MIILGIFWVFFSRWNLIFQSISIAIAKKIHTIRLHTQTAHPLLLLPRTSLRGGTQNGKFFGFKWRFSLGTFAFCYIVSWHLSPLPRNVFCGLEKLTLLLVLTHKVQKSCVRLEAKRRKPKENLSQTRRMSLFFPAENYGNLRGHTWIGGIDCIWNLFLLSTSCRKNLFPNKPITHSPPQSCVFLHSWAQQQQLSSSSPANQQWDRIFRVFGSFTQYRIQVNTQWKGK